MIYHLITLAILMAYVASAGDPCQLTYRGVNIAVAEFGDSGDGHKLSPNPGTMNVNYKYPEPGGSTSYFVKKGLNTFRLPFRWERLQKALGGSLDSTELSYLKSAVNEITKTNGAYALLDPHNYARYNGVIIGQSNGQVTNAHFADFWKRLANEFKDNSKVLFGLMNEPYSMDTDKWAATANAAIQAIRGTGATNLITVPGTRWTGAHSWQNSGGDSGSSNAQAMSVISDPLDNFVFELHQYLDSDYSGTSASCPSATQATSAVSATTAFFRKNGYKALLGEFGGGTSQTCIDAANNLISHMEDNSDVWVGWTWWAAGPWWGSYFLSVEPSGNTDATQMTKVLSQHVCSSSGSSPTKSPTKAPTTGSPTKSPTTTTGSPTKSPTRAPTNAPTSSTSTAAPTKAPTKVPTSAPTTAGSPTKSPTSAPTSSSSSSCKKAWQQCGGSGYSGSTCCESGYYCKYADFSYSQCSPGDGVCKAQWEQCGGSGYSGVTCCSSGSTCQKFDDFYSQCVPQSFAKHAEGVQTQSHQRATGPQFIVALTSGLVVGVLAGVVSVHFAIRRYSRQHLQSSLSIPLTKN